MRSFGFLLSRRWALFAVTVVLLCYAAWWLGQWQFHRLDDRKERNAIIRANEDRTPEPVADVLAPGRQVDGDDEWRLITATGSYDTDDTVIVRYRTRDGQAGVDIVVPLIVNGTTGLLVDRGWMPAENGAPSVTPPATPDGEVTVVGWVRADGTGDSVAVSDQSVRAISSEAIGDALDRELYGGFVELKTEDGESATSLERVELPELDNGPHFFYGLQWWFFGLLAIFGFFYLAYDERRGGPRAKRPPKIRQTNVDPRYQRARNMPPSTGTIAPETKDEAGDSKNAAT